MSVKAPQSTIQQLGCLFKNLFRLTTNKNPKLSINDHLCVEFTSDRWSTPHKKTVICGKRFHGPLTKYAKLRVALALGMSGTFSPSPRVSDPDMHRLVCHAGAVMHVGKGGSRIWLVGGDANGLENLKRCVCVGVSFIKYIYIFYTGQTIQLNCFPCCPVTK